MKNSTSVTVTKRRVRLSVTSIRRTLVKDDPAGPNKAPEDREYADDFRMTITSPDRSAEPTDEEYCPDTEDRGRGLRLPLMLLISLAMYGVGATAVAQAVRVGIETKTVDGAATPGIKIRVGKYSVTTGEGGSWYLEIPAGTYTAKAETKCRVARVAASSNLMPSARSTEPFLTFSLPQDLPAGIMFELDCDKPRTRGKTKGKSVGDKPKGSKLNEFDGSLSTKEV